MITEMCIISLYIILVNNYCKQNMFMFICLARLVQVQNNAKRERSQARLVQSSTPIPINSRDMQTKH